MSLVTEKADVIARFLKEPAVQEVIQHLRDAAYMDFRAAANVEQLRDAHAFAKAVDAMEVALQATVDAGERERLDEERAERHLATR